LDKEIVSSIIHAFLPEIFVRVSNLCGFNPNTCVTSQS